MYDRFAGKYYKCRGMGILKGIVLRLMSTALKSDSKSETEGRYMR